MKSIELTQEHKDKFLEMCKALFPEYSDWKYGSYKINSTDRLFFADKKQSYDFHWFEFCMTHLLLKIRSSLIPIMEQTPQGLMKFYHMYWDITNYVTTQVHPIDYLYEEFKKLPQPTGK